MTSTATSNLRLELQGTGDNAGTWGTNLNTALQMLDRANGAYGDIAIVDGTNTITVTDYTNGDWHYKVWNLTGALTTAADVVVPTYNKFWYVVNSTTGSQVVTVEVSGQTGVVIPDGGWAIVYCDGTDVEKIIDSDDYQPLDAGLTSIAGLTTAANKMIYTTASDTYAVADLTAAGRAILDDADASAQRTTLGVAIGTDVQAYDADLAAVAALASTGIAVRTASNTWAQRAVAGTANEITATNGDGVSGNPTLSLPAALTFTGKTVTGGTLAGVTINATSTINASVIGGTTPAAATFTTLNATGGGSLTGTWSDLGTVTTIDINGGTVDGTVVGGTTPAAATFTTLNATGGGSLTGTWSDLGTVTTVDINGGTIDGVVIGGTTAAAGTFSTLNATGGGALTGTWTDLGTVTTVDLNGGTIDGTVIGGASAGAGTFTTITATTSVTTPLVTNAGTLALSATGANVIALSTNGSEAVRITSSGNVGIGTSSPGSILEVASTSATLTLNDTDGTKGGAINSRVLFEASGVDSGSVGYATGGGAMALQSLGGNLYLQADADNSAASSNMYFFVDGTEAARINSSGSFLLGTTSGSNLLTVAGTASISGALTASGGGALTGTWSDLGTVTTMDLNGGTIDGAVIGGASAAAATVTTLTAGGAAVYPGVITAIGAAGEVVAGNTTGSLATFSNAGAAAISLHGAAANSATVYFGTTGAGGNTVGRLAYDFSVGAMAFYTANTERARIDSSGNLLIGTTVAGASKLVVADDSIQINTAKTPASAAATGTTGEFAWDASYFYICTATNTWRRVAHATW